LGVHILNNATKFPKPITIQYKEINSIYIDIMNMKSPGDLRPKYFIILILITLLSGYENNNYQWTNQYTNNTEY
jgi:hypothetical protein